MTTFDGRFVVFVDIRRITVQTYVDDDSVTIAAGNIVRQAAPFTTVLYAVVGLHTGIPAVPMAIRRKIGLFRLKLQC